MTSQFSPLISEIRQAMRQGQDTQFLRCIVRLADETSHTSAESMTLVIEEIAPLLGGLSGTFARLALLAGVLVDRGASPLALREVLPDRAAVAMKRYGALPELWARAAGNRQLPSANRPVAESVMNDVERTLVADAKRRGLSEHEALLIAYTWYDIDDWLKSLASAMFHREFRMTMGSREQVREAAAAVEDRLTWAHWIYGLSLVRDNEPLIVIDSTSSRGFHLTMSGVGDNFQLHTLLADRLMAPGRGGLLQGEPPEAAWVEAASEGDPGPIPGPTPILRRFRLFDGHGNYVRPEGRPVDIEPLDGVRVLVLHPPKGDYGWLLGRSYQHMVPILTLDREVQSSEVGHWLSRVTPARETDMMAINPD